MQLQSTSLACVELLLGIQLAFTVLAFPMPIVPAIDNGYPGLQSRQQEQEEEGSPDESGSSSEGSGSSGIGSSLLSSLGSLAIKAIPSIIEDGTSALPGILSSGLSDVLSDVLKA